MNPQEVFCLMIACPARGQTGKGNIHIHSLKDKRCICDVCGQTFTTTKGTIFYRLRTDPRIVMCVIVLLAYGCPIQAIVKAFLLDERTVRDWQKRAGQHCQQVHEHLVTSGQATAEGLLHVERRIVQGAKDVVESLIQRTQGKGIINTAFIERLNATFRQRLSPLARRSRQLAQQAQTLVAGMYLVGCFYSFCYYHHSLRLKLSIDSG